MYLYFGYIFPILIIVIIIIIIFSITLSASRGDLSKVNIEEEEIIVHLTSIDHRVDNFLLKCVQSHLKNPLVAQVIVSIHKDAKINWYDKNNHIYDKLYINYLEYDYGPASKYIGLLDMPEDFKIKYEFGKKDGNKNKYFFICDDDIIFNKKTLNKMLKYTRKNARSELFCNGFLSDYYPNILGYRGLLIRSSFFKPELKNMALDMPKSCFRIDDQWIQVYCHMFRIRMSTIRIIKHINDKNIDINLGSDNGLHSTDNRVKMIENCSIDVNKKYNDIPVFTY